MRQRGNLRHSRSNRRIRTNVPPLCHSGLERQRSGGIFYVAERYQHKVKSATWEDSSTHYRSLGMTYRGAVLFYPHGFYSQRSGTAHRPFPTYFNERTEINTVGCPNNCQLSISGFWHRCSSCFSFFPPDWPWGFVPTVVDYFQLSLQGSF